MNYIIEIQRFEQHMITEEKSAATIDKYLRDIRGFCSYLTGQRISKEKVIAYKEHLTGAIRTGQRQFHADCDQSLPAVPRITGLLCPAAENPAPDVLQRGQGADKAGAAPVGKGCWKYPPVAGDPDDLRHRHPGERATIYYSRSGAGR